MKPISILIIVVYILLPVVCFAHPIELHAETSSDVYDVFTSECPDKQNMDICESACCCAEYTSLVYRVINTFAGTILPRPTPNYLHPQVFFPIFVPPQNMS
jgi:hypothetical protein